MNDQGEFTIEEIIEFSKLTIEERLLWVERTYDFVMEVMGEEGRKNFNYLRHLNDNY
ncbi:MAG TPA: hypothetical protein VJB89_02175 [Candidatus Nanoarchaeia archaeon]|nr:hypothetical protein [Candidatus Nanoarchaeia archaeon]